ncbi:hypothetical protein PM082_022993 [Marasmius tenuissimus]|nr:hypothetical protein PM082_022993 [Marasmius tenuissimus]
MSKPTFKRRHFGKGQNAALKEAMDSITPATKRQRTSQMIDCSGTTTHVPAPPLPSPSKSRVPPRPNPPPPVLHLSALEAKPVEAEMEDPDVEKSEKERAEEEVSDEKIPLEELLKQDKTRVCSPLFTFVQLIQLASDNSRSVAESWETGKPNLIKLRSSYSSARPTPTSVPDVGVVMAFAKYDAMTASSYRCCAKTVGFKPINTTAYIGRTFGYRVAFSSNMTSLPWAIVFRSVTKAASAPNLNQIGRSSSLI